MKYEIKIWKDAKKMPNIEPQKAANLLQSVANAVNNAVGAGGNKTNPDILIDQNAGGEDAIQSVDISYITKDVDKHHLWVPAAAAPVEVVNGAEAGIPEAPAALAAPAVPTTNKSRLIKLHIKGNLYLPLDGGLKDDAKRIAGVGKTQGAENKLRDTLLLSQWASVPPEKDLTDHFYRGIIVNIITKAGDFRVITAKKVYVESYVENYNEGEFGTFDLVLVESADFDNKVTVKGLGYEKPSLLDKVKKGIATTAKVVAAVGTTATVVGTVGKTITETVEKFTGETAATRWVKYGFDTASSAGSVAGSTSNIMKNPKDPNTWAKETTNINKNVNERIQKGVDTKEDIPLAKMESMYLAAIQKDPAKYEDYLKASQEEKYNMLKDASKAMRDRAAITKDMEESVAKDKKISAAKKEVKNLEKEYLALITKDPTDAEKYNKATMEDKIKILQEQKKNFDDMQNNYVALIKLDPKKYDEYNKASTDQQLKMLQDAKKSEELVKADPAQAEKYSKATDEEKLKMLQDAKKNFDDMESKYLDEIKKDPKKYEEYQKATADKQLEMLNEAKKASEGTAPSSTGSGTSTTPSSPGSGTNAPSSGTNTNAGNAGNGNNSNNGGNNNNNGGNNNGNNNAPPSNNNSSNSGTKSAGAGNLNDRISSAAQKKNGDSNGTK